MPRSSNILSVLRALGRTGGSGCRSYGLLSNIGETTQQALAKTRSAAEELRKAAAVSQPALQLKQRAAASTSSLGQNLEEPGGATAEGAADELPKGSKEATSSGGSRDVDGSGSGGAKAGAEPTQEQQPEQEQQHGGRQSGGGAASPQQDLLSRVRQAAAAVLREMRTAVLPEATTASALRGAARKAGDLQAASTSALAVAAEKEAPWAQRQWREMADKLGSHPFFRSLASGLGGSRVLEAGREAAEKVRERWETSDSPLVHRIQDATDSFFAEGEAAQALREIRARDPGFDMVRFLQHLKHDVRVVIRGYLSGDEAVIHEHCSPEMIERLLGILRAERGAGRFQDPTLLDTSDVELVDLKMLDDSPIVVAQFTCQQIDCVRDAHGNVVEGAPDRVHRVYYYWALQQEAAGFVGEDGGYHPPRWQLREMLIRGMHALL